MTKEMYQIKFSFQVFRVFMETTPQKQKQMTKASATACMLLATTLITCGQTYSPGLRGLISNGEPGVPRCFGKMSTHICSLPCGDNTKQILQQSTLEDFLKLPPCLFCDRRYVAVPPKPWGIYSDQAQERRRFNQSKARTQPSITLSCTKHSF